MKKALLLMIFVAFTSIHCKKNTGLSGNYCVCKINGKYWQAGCSGSLYSVPVCITADLSDSGKNFLLSCSNDASQISIFLNDSMGLKSGTYVLKGDMNINGAPWQNGAQYQDYSKSLSLGYNTDSVYIGTVTINIDVINKQVYGTFSFRAIFDYVIDTVNVTEGQFSLPVRID